MLEREEGNYYSWRRRRLKWSLNDLRCESWYSVPCVLLVAQSLVGLGQH